MLKMKVNYLTYPELKFSVSDPLRSESAHGASSVKDWKVKQGDQKAWWSWRAAIPQVS